MSSDPRRLFDDPEASELLRSDLAEVREHPGVHFDASAGLARLTAALGEPVPAPDPSGSGAGTGPAPAASTTLTAGAKLALVVAVGAVVAAGAWLALRPPSVPNPPTPAAVVTMAAPTPTPSAASPSAAPEVPSVPSIDVNDLPQLKLTAKPAPSAEPPLSPEERLRAEMKQLAEVRSAVGSSPARGLELANQGHQQFKSGVFYQEREALAISALVRLGRGAEAKQRARGFLTSFPKGPYAERVRKEAGLDAP